jgi:hypothetical protein
MVGLINNGWMSVRVRESNEALLFIAHKFKPILGTASTDSNPNENREIAVLQHIRNLTQLSRLTLERTIL